jgi:hypothetical protein
MLRLDDVSQRLQAVQSIEKYSERAEWPFSNNTSKKDINQLAFLSHVTPTSLIIRRAYIFRRSSVPQGFYFLSSTVLFLVVCLLSIMNSLRDITFSGTPSLVRLRI